MSSPTHPAVRWTAIAASVVPFALVVWAVTQYGLLMPHYDQWAMAPVLDHFYTGSLRLSDFWAQQVEHRSPIPRLIMLLLASYTSWDIRYELALNLILALITFLVLARLIREVFERLELDGFYLFLPVLSVLVFSLRQWENWVWGWQLSYFLVNLCAVSGITVLYKRELRPRHYMIALGLGVVATLSFLTAVAYWVVGGILLALRSSPNPRTRYGWLGVWAAAAGGLCWIYFLGYNSPASAADPNYLVEHPVQAVIYAFGILGNPVAFRSGHHEAFLMGAGGLPLFIGCLFLLRRADAAAFEHIAPVVCLGLFALGNASLIAMGRVRFGPAQSLSSRYVSIALFLWVSNLLLLRICASTPWNLRRIHHRLRNAVRWTCTLLFLALLTSAVLGSVHGVNDMKQHHEQCDKAARTLVRNEESDTWLFLHPSIEFLKAFSAILREHKLSLFSDASAYDTGAGTSSVDIFSEKSEYAPWTQSSFSDPRVWSVSRFFSPRTFHYFYTGSAGEKEHLVNMRLSGWNYEKEVFLVYGVVSGAKNLTPVYRLCNARTGSHRYTLSEDEKNRLVETPPGWWRYEGIAWYAWPEPPPSPDAERAVPVHTFWSPSFNTQFLTCDPGEKSRKESDPYWTYEGIAFYALSPDGPDQDRKIPVVE